MEMTGTGQNVGLLHCPHWMTNPRNQGVLGLGPAPPPLAPEQPPAELSHVPGTSEHLCHATVQSPGRPHVPGFPGQPRQS